MSRLLVIEDDVTIATTLELALRAGGHTVFWASTGRAGINAAIAHKPQLVLLDLGLPDLDGLSVCREIRSLLPATIIVLLTAHREELDVVSGLESGADDYLTKPFRVVEVLARVGAHLRRANGDSGLVQSVPADDVRVLGSLSVNAAARTVQVNGSNVALPGREYDLQPEIGAPVPGEQLGFYTAGTLLVGLGPAQADAAVRAAFAGKPAETAEGGWISVVVPVASAETVTGAVRAALPISVLWQRVGLTWLVLLVAAAAALLVGIGTARRLARMITDPMEGLTRASLALGGGDFFVRTHPSGLPEIDQAYAALNVTAERLGELVRRERHLSAQT
ncbi:HAMP domain-containing protein [Cryobacterium flavum]|uniref:HAMP domain-containing protein n=1 Tax=Cryobacterium flavum TaxID=1424659 RepID=A0A4R8UVG0_9MICO|nr:response regulator [Cryobacterium flavum]TFB72878.1 response regulator [Cryobacterium flavum]SDO43425.1 HAMP domain-containing protein [Cryobacterium flavum]